MSAGDDEAPGDKPYEATESKIRQAREKGDIPRSTEMSTLFAYLGGAVSLLVLAPMLLKPWMARLSGLPGDLRGAEGAAFAAARDLAGVAALATLAATAVPALVVLLALVAQRGLTFSPERLAPDIKRLNIFKNAAQKFGPKGLATFGTSLLKMLLTLAGGVVLFDMLIGRILASTATLEGQWVAGLGLILQQTLGLAIAVTALVALVDVLWRRFEHLRRLRMSRKELEDEMKSSEGDPKFKAVRRQRAIDIALSTMIADVATADVVIVNPTHYAVALKWTRGSGRAPVCVARGTDEVARRIREMAAKHGVPIWSDPPCARALHAALKPGDEIALEHFAAVAAAIRFAEAMRRKARLGW